MWKVERCTFPYNKWATRAHLAQTSNARTVTAALPLLCFYINVISLRERVQGCTVHIAKQWASNKSAPYSHNVTIRRTIMWRCYYEGMIYSLTSWYLFARVHFCNYVNFERCEAWVTINARERNVKRSVKLQRSFVLGIFYVFFKLPHNEWATWAHFPHTMKRYGIWVTINAHNNPWDAHNAQTRTTLCRCLWNNYYYFRLKCKI